MGSGADNVSIKDTGVHNHQSARSLATAHEFQGLQEDAGQRGDVTREGGQKASECAMACSSKLLIHVHPISAPGARDTAPRAARRNITYASRHLDSPYSSALERNFCGLRVPSATVYDMTTDPNDWQAELA